MSDQPASISEAPGPIPKVRKVRGAVYLNPSRCKGCGFCIAFCPPKVLEFSDEFNSLGYHPPRLVDPDGCTGCDLCGLYCPDFAIYGVILKYSRQGARDAMPATEGAQP
jgi:2-oxoglutarate ferredoxin oxidoreductase subunit delta